MAFAYTGLTDVTLPSKLTGIGSYAFAASKLTHLSLPASLTTIGTSAFGASGLKSAGPAGSGCAIEYAWTTKIPDNAFRETYIKSSEASHV